MAKKKASKKTGGSTDDVATTNAVAGGGSASVGATSLGDTTTAGTDNDEIITTADDSVVPAGIVEGDEEEEELELLQIDLGDMIKIKQVLDETVAGSLLENHTIPEDYRWDNIKLGIMTIACTFAMIAQFVPIPFPESRPVLGICGTLYFVFSGILQFITTFIDQDSILWTLPMTDSKNPEMNKYGFVIRTNLERFTEWYTVTIEFHKDQAVTKKEVSAPASSTKNDKPRPSFVQQRWSIGQFFDKEGYFDEIGLIEEVDKLYHRFVDGKYDLVPLGDVPPPKAKKD